MIHARISGGKSCFQFHRSRFIFGTNRLPFLPPNRFTFDDYIHSTVTHLSIPPPPLSLFFSDRAHAKLIERMQDPKRLDKLGNNQYNFQGSSEQMNKIILVLRNEKKSRTSRYVNLMISFRGTGLMKIGFFFFFFLLFLLFLAKIDAKPKIPVLVRSALLTL